MLNNYSISDCDGERKSHMKNMLDFNSFCATFFKTEVIEKGFTADLPFLPHDLSEYSFFPGFCDVHVHFREPGFSYKETIKSGSLAAAHGGYTAVCTMPNLNPVPDCEENIKIQAEIIKNNSSINVYPYGTISLMRNGKELSDMESMADYAIAFSDDGSGVQNEYLMEEAMIKAKSLGKIIAAHCEDNSLLHGGCIHEGEYAKQNGFIGISSESEYMQIERDLKLVEKTGCAYHVCHISAKESVDLIRKAKKRGLNVSCETAPHYLVLDENDLIDDGRFKMNPPLRSSADKNALVEGIIDGTIDMIATDHAPHSKDEKSKGLKGSAFGISGLETAFPVLYTKLVKNNVITLDRLIELMSINPRKRFDIPYNNDFCVWDLTKKSIVSPDLWFSMGKASPFLNEELFGVPIATVCNGKAVYVNNKIINIEE